MNGNYCSMIDYYVDSQVCKKEDDFVAEQMRWLALLSNGEVIIQDDNRPGMEPSAWRRLGAYVKKNKLNIVDFYLQFRSHTEHPLPKGAAGYFFCNKVGAVCAPGSVTRKLYVVGYVTDQEKDVYTASFFTPEIILESSDVRKLSDILSWEPQCLIMNGAAAQSTPPIS